MKVAFLFPGQGAQFVGMGSDIAHKYPAAAGIFEKADKLTGFDLSRICFEGPAEKLNTTAVSQPAIFVTSAAILEVLITEDATKHINADVTAGLSLGEYTALYAAGALNFEDGLALVQKRGQAMQQAADSTDGAMVSMIGINDQQAAQLCAEAAEGDILIPVNFNCPGQIVVSGSKAACRRAEELAGKYGALKAVRLQVAGAFHTDMISDAAATLEEAIGKCTITKPEKNRVIANINADYYHSASEIAEGLIKQLTCPIFWQRCMERLLADGVEDFYEIGPGRVLTGLMRRIKRKTKVVNLSNLRSIQSLQGDC